MSTPVILLVTLLGLGAIVLVGVLSRQVAALRALHSQLRSEVHEHVRGDGGGERLQEQLLHLDVWLRQLMMSAGQEDQFYAQAAAGIMDLVDADTAAVPLLDDDGGSYTYVAAAGAHADSLRGQTHGFDSQGAFGWVIEHREPLRIHDTTAAARPMPDSIADLGAKRALLAPLSHQGRPIGVMCALRDRPFDESDQRLLLVFAQKVSIAIDNMRLLATLDEQRERAQVTLDSIGDAVITTDSSGSIDYMNPVAEKLTGWRSEDATGVEVERVFRVVEETTREPVCSIVQRCLADGVVTGLPSNAVLLRRDDKQFAIDPSAAPIRDSEGRTIGAVLVFHDVSRSRAMARQLSWQATHDALTGLVNRRQFGEAVRVALDSARERDLTHCLMYLDLDQFKVVNDTCGHIAGDELLKQLTALLRVRVREVDTLARLGGDEFGVLLAGCQSDAGQAVAQKLRETVRAFRFVWKNTTFELGVSIGMVTVTSESKGVPDLLSAADMACHLAKEQGRNRVHVFSAGDAMLEQRQSEMQWVANITSALAEDRFVLYCQPIVPTGGTDRLWDHVEILVRMVSREGKIIPPGAFIPAAERYNLMGEIDRWVVRHVFERYDGRLGNEHGGERPMCAINLSGASMSDENLLDYIRSQFQRYDVPAESICFEITETAAVQNLAVATEFIQELKQLGCRFALDDFGSGLSSFAYLKNLPVDYLKIDGSFVKDMLGDRMNLAIVEACHAIGQAIGVRTIAEFVEDDETLAALSAIGVDYGQGYGIHKPVPLDGVVSPAMEVRKSA